MWSGGVSGGVQGGEQGIHGLTGAVPFEASLAQLRWFGYDGNSGSWMVRQEISHNFKGSKPCMVHQCFDLGGSRGTKGPA